MEEKIKAKITQLEAEMQDYIRRADIEVNARVGEYRGAIATLKTLLVPEPEAPPPAE